MFKIKFERPFDPIPARPPETYSFTRDKEYPVLAYFLNERDLHAYFLIADDNGRPVLVADCDCLITNLSEIVGDMEAQDRLQRLINEANSQVAAGAGLIAPARPRPIQ